MSPQDISRIQPITAGRSIAREPADAAAKSPLKPDEGKPNDSGVKVETGLAATPGQAPVDQTRVAEIRKAIQQGTYPVNPAQIADAMIAAPLLLSAER